MGTTDKKKTEEQLERFVSSKRFKYLSSQTLKLMNGADLAKESKEHGKDYKKRLLDFAQRNIVVLCLFMSDWLAFDQEQPDKDKSESNAVVAAIQAAYFDPSGFLTEIRDELLDCYDAQRCEDRQTCVVDPAAQAKFEAATSQVYKDHDDKSQLLQELLLSLPVRRKQKEVVELLLKQLRTAPKELEALFRDATEKKPQISIHKRAFVKFLGDRGITVSEDTVNRLVKKAMQSA